MKFAASLGVFTLLALGSQKASAQDWNDSGEIKHVFVIAMENHNWTQPMTVPGAIEPIFQNPNAPFEFTISAPFLLRLLLGSETGLRAGL